MTQGISVWIYNGKDIFPIRIIDGRSIKFGLIKVFQTLKEEKMINPDQAILLSEALLKVEGLK